MPRMGLNMEEGTILRWLKRRGERVASGEDLFEIETDKTNLIIQAPADGILQEILYDEGDTVPIGTVIAKLTRSENAPVSQTTPPISELAPVKASPAARRLAHQLGVDLSRVQGSGPEGRIVARNVRETTVKPQPDTPTRARKPSPLARRTAEELGVDLAQVQGTGLGGQITREDVERAASRRAAEQSERVAPPTVPASPDSLPPTAIEPVSNVHRVMAARMAASFATAPHFYLHTQTDARALIRLREQLRARLEERAGVHLTLTDLLIQLAAHALKLHPNLRAQWAEPGLRPSQDIHIGVAVEAPAGLFVPVLQNADKQSLTEIARWRVQAIDKARAGRLLPADLEGGIFTISNLGMYRVDWFEAILNPPQAAILAVGRMREQPWVQAGQVIAAPAMNLSLSVDHRVVDGAQAARFMSDLAELIENPAMALA